MNGLKAVLECSATVYFHWVIHFLTVKLQDTYMGIEWVFLLWHAVYTLYRPETEFQSFTFSYLWSVLLVTNNSLNR